MKKTILLFMIMLLFTACDPGVSYSRIVQNDSDFDVKVFIAGTIYSRTDTILIEKNITKTIFTDHGLGTVYDFTNCDFPKDSIPMLIYFNDSTKLIPDINKLSDWNFRIIKKGTFDDGGVCECRILLTNTLLNELQ